MTALCEEQTIKSCLLKIFPSSKQIQSKSEGKYAAYISATDLKD